MNLCMQMQVRLPAWAWPIGGTGILPWACRLFFWIENDELIGAVLCFLWFSFRVLISGVVCQFIFAVHQGKTNVLMYVSCLFLVYRCWIRLVFTEHDQKPSPFGCFAPVLFLSRVRNWETSGAPIFRTICFWTGGRTWYGTHGDWHFKRTRILFF